MSDLNAALAAIWERSRPLVRERLETVEAAASALQAGTLDDAARQEGVRASHQLAGSLGTFGMVEGTEVARALEGELGGGPDPARVAELSARLRALLEPRLG
jgi:HPt (histidine-containing phosphotransfer) domain-containing protein